ncbi:MAG: DUF2993 domain-containing protein [Candidatus Sericytochromatia bacterium]|nr:DUF2993 domain-containing protein [Candidatus Sericytochromatia bacterium]
MSIIAALGVIVVLATGSAAPGQVGEVLERELERRWGPTSSARAEVLADPFLDLTRGRLETLRVEARHVPCGPVRLPRVRFEAQDVRVPGHSLYGIGAPVLLAPASARVRLEASAAELTAEALRLKDAGSLDGLAVPAGPLVSLLGPRLGLSDVRVTTDASRIHLEAKVHLGRGAARPVSASFVPVLGGDHRSIRGTGWEVALGGKPLPAALLRLAGRMAPPLLDLNRLTLPGPGWRIEQLSVSPEGIVVEAAGTLASGAP